MLERTIIVPDKDNDGASLARERHDIERSLLTLAGGYTADKVRGAWMDGGKVYHDSSTRYTLAVDQETDEAIVARLSWWASLLRQQALYTSVRPVTVTFVSPVTEASHAA